MENIYICPLCGSAYERSDSAPKICPSCGVEAVNSGFTAVQWNAQPPEARKQRIQRITGTADAAVPRKTNNGGKVPPAFSKTVSWDAAYTSGTSRSSTQKAAGNASIISGVILLVIGVIALLYALITYSNDTSSWFGYNYRSPLTDHEMMVIFWGCVGAGGIVGGLVDIFIGLSRRNK